MHIPNLLERVRLTGLDEVYLVMRVDHEGNAADLLPIVYGRQQLDAVPFVIIEQIPGCGPPDWMMNGFEGS